MAFHGCFGDGQCRRSRRDSQPAARHAIENVGEMGHLGAVGLGIAVEEEILQRVALWARLRPRLSTVDDSTLPARSSPFEQKASMRWS